MIRFLASFLWVLVFGAKVKKHRAPRSYRLLPGVAFKRLTGTHCPATNKSAKLYARPLERGEIRMVWNEARVAWEQRAGLPPLPPIRFEPDTIMKSPRLPDPPRMPRLSEHGYY